MDVESMHDKSKFRGKLYALSEETVWSDQGTGYVAIVGTGDNRRLLFRDEASKDVIHDRPIFSTETYQLQGEGERLTIIVWEDPETHKDWALSFQDPDGTSEVWAALSKEEQSERKKVLPQPKLSNLMEIGRTLTCVPPSQREGLASECLAPEFIENLRECFHTAEDLSDESALNDLWCIARGVFLLSNQKLTERYLQRDLYEDVMGMLEYDDGLPKDKRIAHRQVLQVKVRFQHVVSFEDDNTLERVHLNYRLQYLKDIVLPRILDDAAFAGLTQMIHANLSIILDHVQKNAQIIDRLFAQIQQKDLQALLFLQDVCRMAKLIPPGERQALYEKLIGVQCRLFKVLAPYIGDSEGKQCDSTESRPLHPPRYSAVEILLLSALNDPSQLRRFLTAEDSAEGRKLLADLIRMMHVEADQGLQGQIAEMLKSIMDPTALEHKERDSSLDVFYDRGALDELALPLRAFASSQFSSSSHSFCFAQQLACEMLAFAVAHHGYRARVYVMRSGLAQQAARLMAVPHKFLQLAPVRLIRAMVMTKDDAYHRYLLKTGIFVPLMRNLQMSLAPPALGANLIVSATLELLEFIRIQNIKSLVDHVCRRYAALLQEYAPRFKTFEGLLLKHQQNLEYEAFPPEQHAAGGPILGQSGAATVRGSGRVTRSPGRDSDDDDEAYFESLDDDDESTGGDGGSDGGSGGGGAPAPGASANQQPKAEALAAGDGSPSPTQEGPLAGHAAEGETGGAQEPLGVAAVAAVAAATQSAAGVGGTPTDGPTPVEADAPEMGSTPAETPSVTDACADGVGVLGGSENGTTTAPAAVQPAEASGARGRAAQETSIAETTNGLVEGLAPTPVENGPIVAGDKVGEEMYGETVKAKASAKAAAGRGEPPTACEEGGDAAGGDSIISEKALNHVPKRLKTSTAA